MAIKPYEDIFVLEGLISPKRVPDVALQLKFNL
jgi:hypothetical protein